MGADANRRRNYDGVWIINVDAGASAARRVIFCEGEGFGVGDARTLFADTESDICIRERDDRGDDAFFSASGILTDISGDCADADYSGAEGVRSIGGGVWG